MSGYIIVDADLSVCTPSQAQATQAQAMTQSRRSEGCDSTSRGTTVLTQPPALTRRSTMPRILGRAMLGDVNGGEGCATALHGAGPLLLPHRLTHSAAERAITTSGMGHTDAAVSSTRCGHSGA